MGNWQKIRLGDILSESKVESISPNNESRIRVLLNAKGVIKRPVKKETKGATKYFIRKKGQFIYGKQNIHKGAFGIVPDELDGFESTSDLPAFDVDGGCLPLWIDYYLKQGDFYLSLVNIARGAATKRVQPKELLELKIPLPSIEEQEKVIAHFKSIETEDAELRHEFTHQQSLLKKLRQSILQEAIEGKLTADWRQQNPDVKPASELLARIQIEKEWLIKDKKIKKQKPLPPIREEEKPFELPEGWVWTRIGEITNVVTSGSRNWKSLYSESGASFIRSQDIKLDCLHYANRAYVNVDKGKEGTRTYVNQYDWLIIITGANVGKCAYISGNLGEAYVSQHVGLMRPTIKEIGEFGHLWLIANFGGRGLLSGFIYGDKPGLNLPQLRNLLIPIPSINEQKAIVKKVEKLLTICDQLEIHITTNQTHAKQLMQAVLKEAFEENIEKPKESKVVKLKPHRPDYYKRMLLAAEIVDQLHKEPTLGHLKLQKLMFLCQRTENMQLPTNFLQQAAGPYDPKMARSLDKQFKQKKWFEYCRNDLLKFKPLENSSSHKEDFNKYFANELAGIQFLIDIFRKAKSDQLEIVATIYACWDNLLKQDIAYSERLLVERFYDWSEEKGKYEEERIRKAITWMLEKNIVPGK